jgi:phenylalanine-4-hydroxylase
MGMKKRFEEPSVEMRADYTCDNPDAYTPEDHAVWRELFERQTRLLENRACDEYLKSLPVLNVTAEGIPDFRRMSDILEKATRWRLVTVPGLIPGEVFLAHLAKRQFPVTYWIRPREKMDYLVEPDIFHDLFGHVPMLINPVFADYMQEFGKGGIRAGGLDADLYIARLYWFTVEFGLINTQDGPRIYGSGIVSSKTESIYCLEDARPHRIAFDLKRAMRTDFHYDKLQESYFVIDSFEQLFDATRPDFAPVYKEVRKLGDVKAYDVLSEDRLYHKGTVEKEKH